MSALDQHGIAELVSPVPVQFELARCFIEHAIEREGAEHFVVAAAGLVGAGEDGIHYAQPRRGPRRW